MRKVRLVLVPAFLLSLMVPAYALAESGDFKDVDEDFWAENEIRYLGQEGIISGYDDGTFRPNETVKRSQAAAMIVQALDLETEAKPNPDFTDVTKDFHAYDVVAVVRDEGIISGNENGEFMPNDALTRGQMAAVLHRAFDLSGNGENSDYFADMDAKDMFYNDVQVIAQANIASGYEDGTFGPNDDVTRAQFAVFLSKALDKDQFVNPDHTTYTNARFGFDVTYPDSWPAGEEAANGDGKVLYETDNSTIRAYGTHYLENQSPDLEEYEEVTLRNGDSAHYKTTRSDNMIEFDLVRITEDMEYHVNGEVSEAVYSEHANAIRDTIYSLNTSDSTVVEAHAAADEAVQFLRDEDMGGLSSYVHPEQGVTFSPYAYVDTENDQHFSKKEVEELWQDETEYRWGRYDGSGHPIQARFPDYYERFVYDRDFINAEKTSVNERYGEGNTIDNTDEAYPEATIIEYHIPGEEEGYAGMDWKSLRLAMKEEDGAWYVVGVIHDEWTI